MKDYDKCMCCKKVMYEGMLMEETTYLIIAEDKRMFSHGICPSEVCSLEFAMKTSGILDAENELGIENKLLFDELIILRDTYKGVD